MTLDEAIIHAESEARKNSREVDRCFHHGGSWYEEKAKFRKACADEQRQLAEWLKELKAYRGNRNTEPKCGEWIPCSERLPEEDVDDSYLIAWIPANEKVKCDLPHYYQTVDWEDGDWANIDFCGHEEIVILAWMPLPEPWKGADDE